MKHISENAKPMKLKKLLEVLQACYDKHAGAPKCQEAIDVEFWIGDTELEMDSIGQFSVKPDVTISFKRNDETLTRTEGSTWNKTSEKLTYPHTG